jgi:hypothetical protein
MVFEYETDDFWFGDWMASRAKKPSDKENQNRPLTLCACALIIFVSYSTLKPFQP